MFLLTLQTRDENEPDRTMKETSSYCFVDERAIPFNAEIAELGTANEMLGMLRGIMPSCKRHLHQKAITQWL